MSENIYPVESVDSYSTYAQQLQYSKQLASTDSQPYFSYSPALLNNYSQNSNYVDVCTTNTTTSQNITRNQNNYINYQSQEPVAVDILNWESRTMPDLEKVIKFPDKIEMIEITSKDLSPASYCSNIDLLVPELYKTTQGKDSNSYKYENQYYNQSSCSQRSYDYPSCVQYPTQKNYDTDSSLKSCSLISDMFLDTNEASKNPYFSKQCYENYTDSNIYSYCEKAQDSHLSIQNDFFNNASNLQFEPLINSIDQQTEDSNEDSDIIVEDSDEEINSCDVQDKNYPFTKFNKCLICNLVYTPFGIQFYFLTSKSPLTMSSQKPVLDKIVELVGNVPTPKNYLCSECLGLLNTIDHLQLKLDSFNTEFNTKYKKTCTENKTEYQKVVVNNIIYKNRRNVKYRCKICKKVLCLRKYFLFHIKNHRKVGVLCELCGRIFSSRKKFLSHKTRHTKKIKVQQKIEPYKCNNCSKIFRTNSELKCHLNVCLGTLPFKCKLHHCDKKFASHTQLKYHIKLKHDKKFVAICSICNIGFVKIAAYKNHKVTHSTEKKYSCSKCDKSYKTLSNLRFHMKIHNKVLPFTCPICKKGFLRKDYLDTHVNKHKGIRNYECPMCKKSFTSQKSLDTHSKYHEDSKKVTCNICGKTMVNGFKDHLRVHNNLKEFECDLCEQKFNTKGALNKHVKKKHNNDDPKIK